MLPHSYLCIHFLDMNDKQKMYLLLLNDFNNKTNVPDPSKHKIIWESDYRNMYNESVSGLIHPLKAYRYVSLWISNPFATDLYALEVYPQYSE